MLSENNLMHKSVNCDVSLSYMTSYTDICITTHVAKTGPHDVDFSKSSVLRSSYLRHLKVNMTESEKSWSRNMV